MKPNKVELSKFTNETNESLTKLPSLAAEKESERLPPLKKKGIPQGKYQLGQHGFKKTEQKRLTKKYATSISGKTHESEHTVGFAVLNKTSGMKRGKEKRARELEKKAPAYQERKQFHRAHIGTGSKSKVDKSGFSSATYRAAQRRLLEAGDVSSAVQINQLGYAFLQEGKKNFQEKQDSPGRKAARDSFLAMAERLERFDYAEGDQTKTIFVDKRQQAEIYLARKAAETGKWPTAEEIAAVKKKFGLN